MSYTVNITDAADNDLRAIFAYIAFELQSYQNAVGQLARLESEILITRYKKTGPARTVPARIRVCDLSRRGLAPERSQHTTAQRGNANANTGNGPRKKTGAVLPSVRPGR